MFPEHVAVFTYLRDNGKPVTERDAADLAAVRTWEAPTLEHFDRLKVAPECRFRERAKRAVRRSPAERAEFDRAGRSVDQWRAYRAAAGGSRTVRPAPSFGTGPKKAHTYNVVSSDRELEGDAHVGVRQRQAADHLRAIWHRYHGPLTRFQQAEYAYLTGDREEIIYA